LSQSAGAGLGEEAAQQAVASKLAAATPVETLTAGYNAATATPSAMGAFAKQNLGNLAYAASPILAGAMVPTTTKVDAAKNDNYIRQFDFNIDPETGKPNPLYGVRAMAPVKANEWKDKTFQGQRDLFRQQNPNPYDIGVASLNRPPQQQMGMAGGGIVALAEGGASTPPAITSVEDLYTQILGRTGEQTGLDYWKAGFGDTVDANEIASFRQAAQAELANRTPVEQQILAPNLVNTGGGAPAVTSVADLYQGILGRAPESVDVTNYWQNQFGNTIDANELAQFKTAAQAEIDARNAGTTGGITNLATTGGTSLTDAQNQVNNMYRNVLGRDADPAGLAFWSNAIASGRPAENVYQDFLTSARANTELVRADQIKNKTFAEATTPYKGYMSTDTGNIVDEWVRNTLGREPTDADRQQQWYKDAADKMRTQEQAKGLYGQFQGYATKEATTEMANRIRTIDAELRAKNLTEADLLAQTGKTKQQLASEGLNTGLNWMGASQLAPAASRTKFDLQAALKKLTPITNTFGGDSVPRTVTNPYGNETNPGDLTFNQDGTTTVTPNIPYRPYGGFSGIQEIKDAYTKGGGSLGYTSRVPKSIDEFNQMYNKQTGDSLAAYNYLMGKGANPVKSGAPKIAVPYDEFALGKKTSALKPPTVTGDTLVSGGVSYDLTDPTKPPPADSKGVWTWNVLNKRWNQPITASTNVSASGTYDGGSGGVGGNSGGPSGGSDGAIGTGGMGAEGGDGAQSGGGADNARGGLMPHGAYHMANGGMMGYAMGGGLGSLGSYSDGGRLLKGPGDGVSDSIPATIGRKQQPARLADGEFVIPARIVSELGNGSTDAGAKKLYAMMDRVQKARGKTTGKNKVAANSRSDKYLPA
jgi:hypothetical protein